jgi:hypothetical protein
MLEKSAVMIAGIAKMQNLENFSNGEHPQRHNLCGALRIRKYRGGLCGLFHLGHAHAPTRWPRLDVRAPRYSVA